MTTPQMNLQRIAALEALRGQLHNLEESIKSLLELMRSMPEGEIREKLFGEISALDSIADVMKQAVEAWPSQKEKSSS